MKIVRRFKEDNDPMFTLTSQDKHGILTNDYTCCGGNQEHKILEDFYTNREIRVYDECPTLRADRHGLKVIEESPKQELRIRKLTPTECWRLMGFEDNDINKCIEVGMSNTQLYKQAGNSIVVNVLEEIFNKLFKSEACKKRVLLN